MLGWLFAFAASGCGGVTAGMSLGAGPAGAGGGQGGGGGQSAVRTVSPGLVTFAVHLPATTPYCDPVFEIEKSDGTVLETSLAACETICGRAGVCEEARCPPTFPNPGGLMWDGSVYVHATCDASGDSAPCVGHTFADPGRYRARVCAAHGTMVPNGDARPYVCRSAGGTDCVDVSFDFPTSSPVEVSLPAAPDGSAP